MRIISIRFRVWERINTRFGYVDIRRNLIWFLTGETSVIIHIIGFNRHPPSNVYTVRTEIVDYRERFEKTEKSELSIGSSYVLSSTREHFNNNNITCVVWVGLCWVRLGYRCYPVVYKSHYGRRVFRFNCCTVTRKRLRRGMFSCPRNEFHNVRTR